MSITVTQAWDVAPTREGNATADIKPVFTIRGTDSETLARAALKAFAVANPTSPDGLLVADEVSVNSRTGNTVWQGSINYVWPNSKPKPKPETKDVEISFDITGQTLHIERSLETLSSHGELDPAIDPPPDFGQLINVTQDGVQGTDIVVPQFGMSETHYVPRPLVTDQWVHDLADCIGTVCDHAHRSFAIGEMLWTSASGSRRSEDDWEITFGFSREKNATDLAIGGIVIPMKRGHDFVWTRREETVEDNKLVWTPRYAYVERVYEYRAWQSLFDSIQNWTPSP